MAITVQFSSDIIANITFQCINKRVLQTISDYFALLFNTFNVYFHSVIEEEWFSWDLKDSCDLKMGVGQEEKISCT